MGIPHGQVSIYGHIGCSGSGIDLGVLYICGAIMEAGVGGEIRVRVRESWLDGIQEMGDRLY